MLTSANENRTTKKELIDSGADFCITSVKDESSFVCHVGGYIEIFYNLLDLMLIKITPMGTHL